RRPSYRLCRLRLVATLWHPESRLTGQRTRTSNRKVSSEWQLTTPGLAGHTGLDKLTQAVPAASARNDQPTLPYGVGTREPGPGPAPSSGGVDQPEAEWSNTISSPPRTTHPAEPLAASSAITCLAHPDAGTLVPATTAGESLPPPTAPSVLDPRPGPAHA